MLATTLAERAPGDGRHRRPRQARRAALTAAAAVLVAALAILTALVASPSPASAHAVVVASSPAAGQVVARSPSEAWVQFSEPVSADGDGITVLNAQGQRVDEGSDAAAKARDIVRADLPADLPDGTYVINYRVISVDGHPIAGALVFAVGEGTTVDPAAVAGLEAGVDRGFEVAGVIARTTTYVGALLAAGLAAFLAFFHDGRPDRRRLASLGRAATFVGALGAALTVAVQAALVTGRGFGAMTDGAALRRAFTEGLGWSTAVLLAGLAVVYLVFDVRRPTLAQVLAFYGGLAVTVSFVFWGHASSAPRVWLAMGADAVHVTAAALWFGGLVGLGVVLSTRARAARQASRPVVAGQGPGPAAPIDPDATAAVGTVPAGPPDDEAIATAAATAGIVARFSDAAAISVLVLVVAGVVLSTTQVGGLGELWSTTYGRLLVAKVAVVLVVLAAAAYNRWRLVPDVEAAGASGASSEGEGEGEGDPRPGWRRLATTVRLEALLIVAVLAITAVLVNVTPARSAQVQSEAVANFTAPLTTGQVNVLVTPAEVGTNVVHIQYFDDAGRPLDAIKQVSLELTERAKGVGPIEPPAPTRIAPGHYIANGVDVPLAGTWDLTLITRTSDFEQDRTTFPVEIRS